ncbi:MAG: energy transducer TonB [Blastocatellia bacterium]
MRRFVIVFLPALLVVSQVASFQVLAQSPARKYGPVVGAYLSSLDKDLLDLDGRLAGREMELPDYERHRHRLLLARSQVARLAGERGDDVIPDVQVVTAGDAGALGLSRPPDWLNLKTGIVLDGRWKLLGVNLVRGAISEAGERFFVFENVLSSEGTSLEMVDPFLASLLARKPRAVTQGVIETIRILEETPWYMRTAQSSGGTGMVKEVAAPPARTTSAQDKSSSDLRLTRMPLPDYSESARARKIEGDVLVGVLFNRDGKVQATEVTRGLGQGIDELALAAARAIQFEPARVNGQPVDKWAIVVYQFGPNGVTARLAPQK